MVRMALEVFNPLPEKRDAFLEVLRDSQNGVQSIRNTDGCLSVECLESADDGQSVVLFHKWESTAKLLLFRSARLAPAIYEAMELFAKRPTYVESGPIEGLNPRGGRSFVRNRVDTRRCYNCGKTGHISRDCDEERHETDRVCYNCDGPGHIARDCPEEPRSRNRHQAEKACYTCGEIGHLARDCK